jgi:hypothetical protein
MRRISIIAAALVAFSGLGVAFAAVTGVPEIDRPNATLQMKPKFQTPVMCAGEDGINYSTLRGTWKGPETDVTPGSTDYNLAGNVTVKKVVWTINMTTQRGLLKGSISLVDPMTGSLNYQGSLTLITQGIPQPGQVAEARGWIVARTFIAGVADGGSLLANVEAQIDNVLNFRGLFGDAPPNFGTLDYSVTTINQTC